MKTRLSLVVALPAAFALSASTTALAGPTFIHLGVLPEESPDLSSQAWGISANGAVVVGDSNSDSSYDHAFRWTSDDMEDLGCFTGDLVSGATAVNPGGAIVVGFSEGIGHTYAFHWAEAGGVRTFLGPLPGSFYSKALGVSGNGGVVVGVSGPLNARRAVRWVNFSPPMSLGTLPGGTYSYAADVSNNGLVTVGYSSTPTGEHAFRWESGKGMTDLGTFAMHTNSRALAISADGSTAVGYSDNKPALWTGKVIHGMGLLPGSSYAKAYAVSRSGNAVAGETDGGVGGSRAFLWRAGIGLTDLTAFLTAQGIDLDDWELSSCTAISDDGTAIAGWGIYKEESIRGWLVTGLSSLDTAPPINALSSSSEPLPH